MRIPETSQEADSQLSLYKGTETIQPVSYISGAGKTRCIMCNNETTPIINKSPHNKSPQDGLETNVRPQIMKQREGKPQRKCLRTLVWARLSQTGPQKHRIQRQKLEEISAKGVFNTGRGDLQNGRKHLQTSHLKRD